MPDSKATTISLKSIASSAGPAVAAALKRHNIKTGGSLVINPGTLAGPLLEATVDLKVAQQIAEDVAKGMQQPGAGLASADAASLQLTPAVLVTRNHILCGVIPFPAPMLAFGE